MRKPETLRVRADRELYDAIMANAERERESAWKAAHTAREESTGLRAAEDALAAANKVAWGIMAEITAMPATTLAGLIAKTIVARGDLAPDEMDSEIGFEDYPCERLELSILRDLLALRAKA